MYNLEITASQTGAKTVETIEEVIKIVRYAYGRISIEKDGIEVAYGTPTDVLRSAELAQQWGDWQLMDGSQVSL